MRIRAASDTKTSSQNSMAAMIDVVFLLLIFFMLTLQVREPEGDFRMAMASEGVKSPAPQTVNELPIRVRLHADDQGTLRKIQLGQRDLGMGNAAFDRLRREMRVLSGLGLNEEVLIDADYQLNYADLMRTVSSCRGERDAKSGRMIPFFEKIQLTQPRKKQ